MTDLLFPTWARVASVNTEIVSNTIASRSIFTGKVNTVGQGGDRLRFGVNIRNTNRRETDPNRSMLQAIRAALRGQSNRIWFYDPSYVQRGSFPSTELLINNTFSNGSTGWSSYGSDGATLTVADRTLLARSLGYHSFGFQKTAVAVTQYAQYLMRVFLYSGKGNLESTCYGDFSNILTVFQGMNSSYSFPLTSSTDVGVYDGPTSGPHIASDYFTCPYVSYARVMLVDNGPNLTTYSDQFDNAAWSKTNASIGINTYTAPDGTATADALVETAATGLHYFQSAGVTVSSSAGNYSVSVPMLSVSRNWAFIALAETTGGYGSAAIGYFNLASGVVGSIVTGANWSNVRIAISPMGGWYKCTVSGRKTNSATELQIYIGAATNDLTNSYTGTGGANAIAVWRATLALSNVPTRVIQTTSSGTSGSAQSGSNLYVKGLLPSTNGLLLPGDRVQIGTQLNIVTASLDSDAAGLGYLQCAIPWRTSPADNDPIIVNNPMARCVLVENNGGWNESPGGFSDFDFVFEEALD